MPARVGHQRPHNNFHFEVGWVEDEQCAVLVENAWKVATQVLGGSVVNVVRVVAGDMGEWSRNILGNLEKRIKGARRKLEQCRR